VACMSACLLMKKLRDSMHSSLSPVETELLDPVAVLDRHSRVGIRVRTYLLGLDLLGELHV